MTRPETHGIQWNDNKCHIFHTVLPELYNEIRPGFKNSNDCLVNLSLVMFLFNSSLIYVEILELGKEVKATVKMVNEILNNYPDYPIGESNEYDLVFVSVPEESKEVIYNTSNSLMNVFPGEDHGLHSDDITSKILSITLKKLQCEGGNEVVFQHLPVASLRMLDLDVFARAIIYNVPAGGITALNLLQFQGRQNDHTNITGRVTDGIWFENFAIPSVIKECLMQSYDGMICFFPRRPMNKDAEFNHLRATGSFLISAKRCEGKTQFVRVKSLIGESCRIKPGIEGNLKVTGDRNFILKEEKPGIFTIDLKKGEKAIIWTGEKMPGIMVTPVEGTNN